MKLTNEMMMQKHGLLARYSEYRAAKIAAKTSKVTLASKSCWNAECRRNG